jgi:Family of unknown function (DUF6152)
MRRDAIMAIWLFAILASMPARAHHSFSSVFDGKKPITLTGSVTKIEWANPHIHLYIDVKDETGHVINWAIEMGSPNMLIRLGLTRDAMKVGDVVTIEGHLARDGSRLANARTVFMAGKKMFAASSQGSTL